MASLDDFSVIRAWHDDVEPGVPPDVKRQNPSILDLGRELADGVDLTPWTSGRNPTVIAASCLYVAAQVRQGERTTRGGGPATFTQHNVRDWAGASDVAIRETYQDVIPAYLGAVESTPSQFVDDLRRWALFLDDPFPGDQDPSCPDCGSALLSPADACRHYRRDHARGLFDPAAVYPMSNQAVQPTAADGGER